MRIQKSATFSVEAPVREAFLLFGPIREKDWAHGWDPKIFYPNDSAVEKHMVFLTQGGLHGSQETYTWIIVNYDPDNFMIEYLVSASERFWFITVRCSEKSSKTLTTVTYSYTGLTDDARKKNEIALNEMFKSELKDWEAAINYYITTGKQLISQ